MTTVERDTTHLRFPSTERLKDRLAQANKEKLILYDTDHKDISTGVVDLWGHVTPSKGGDAYVPWLRWDMIQGYVWSCCTCIAGKYGTPCKHTAMLADMHACLGEQWIALDAHDFTAFLTDGTLPVWKEKEDDKPED